MIKGNESPVENVNFLTPLSQNFKMLHFDANWTIGHLVIMGIMKDLTMLKTLRNKEI